MSNSQISTNKSFTVAKSGNNYAYIHHPPSNPSKPTVLFLHGFPSTAHDWRHQVPYLTSLGYGVLAPDLLGYGSSSKPLDVEPYIGSSMAADIVSLLDYEGIRTVVGVGHDWGTYLLSQLIIWFPERVERCVFVSVPFHVPGRKTDAKAVNDKSKKALGFELLGYWMFLTAPGAGRTIGDNWEVFYDLVYCADASLWKTHWAGLGAMESTLKTLTPSSSSKHLAPWTTPSDKTHHHNSFGNDYSPTLNWYHRGISSLGVDAEISALKEGKISSKIDIPTLMIGGTKDVVCDATHARKVMQSSVEREKLKVVDLETGHWINLEEKEKFNEVLREWLEETSGEGGARPKL
ncbi:alpha/beta-hydrolase [Mollisia scopiformis]|uniref:Alpha/beta-hydrolase n=1 Tax=Mollisia scopiformis TaxID=149040 RepID=A0A194WYM3_MOLSC|nr:alpha/beta-hydrolase [Mollisia scopiformis]KUJ13058.1 alpha/beta-hydrolase [Mollisia scopiformis]